MYSRLSAEVTTLRLGTGRRPVFTNGSPAHDTIWFECHLMRTALSTRRGTDGRRNRDRSSKRRSLVSHCCLFRGAFGGIPMAVPVAFRIKELNPVGVDEIPVVLGARLFVVPRLRTLPAFEINAGLCEAKNYEQ